MVLVMFGDDYKETAEQRQMFRLLAAIQQVDNITKLTKDNDWKEFIYSHLTPIKFELERQYRNILQGETETNGKRI